MHPTTSRVLRALALPLLLAPLLAAPAGAQEKLHFTYMWHMEQPVYWPDRQAGGADRYERAWESILRTDGGAQHPENDLRQIFSVADRVAAYQWRPKDSIQAISGYAEAGAQVSFSGGLIENLSSLGAVSQLGYSPTWYSSYRTARGWTTVGQSKRRCDLVLFPFHHPLAPLIDESALRKELQLQKQVYPEAWGSGGLSNGFFPPETAFSTRLVGVLASEGVQWTFVSGEKLSRACADFPVVLGTGGINCDPPNAADQLNPAQTDWFRKTISVGCSPAEAYPFAFTPHRAQHVDPETGAVSSVIVVPTSQSLGWDDGYSPLGIGSFDTLQAKNDPSRPMLVVLAHDGDNNWGGGFSYYMQAVPDLVATAQAAGYHATVVEEYLADHPVPANDFVHVEDGAWVNAAGDFGAPQFLNWNWPPVDASGDVDVANGWAEDIRNWAVITAAQNHVDTAEQIWTDGGGAVDLAEILHPDGGTNAVERAWHYFLGALNSGYMYYGTALDMEVKQTIACNEALQHTAGVIGAGTLDLTGPTIWIPQRHPWNPGGLNFGAIYGYQQVQDDGDFEVWTFVHDVSGLQAVTLKYRVDADGQNPLATTENETYAGGAGVGAWQALAMTARAFPAGNFFNDPNIDFFELPAQIATQYHAEIAGERSVLLDYYVEAVDTRGNVKKSPIQHVWVGDGSGATGGGDRVEVLPDPPQAGSPVEVRFDPAGGPLAGAGQVRLHYGFDGWSTVNPSDPAMTWDAPTSRWVVTVSVAASATQLDLVFHSGTGTWDNNGGQDWHFAVQGGVGSGWTMDGQLDAGATLVGTTNGASLWAGVANGELYVATEAAGGGQDRFVLVAGTPGALRPAMWAKAGQVAGWDAYLANEADNGYHAWFDASGATQAARGAVLEGTLDLAGELGSVPSSVRVALAPYATADGGALDATRQVLASVNADGTVDAVEYATVATGGGTGAPAGTPRCFCDPGQDPCANPDPLGGCANSTGVGAALHATGSVSVAAQGTDPLVLHATNGPPNKTALWLQGATTLQTPFRDGNLCVGDPTLRLPPRTCDGGGSLGVPSPLLLDATGALSTDDGTYGFDLVQAALCKSDDLAANAPTTRHYQLWYRDGMGPCASGSNLTNAVQIDWGP